MQQQRKLESTELVGDEKWMVEVGYDYMRSIEAEYQWN